MSDERLTRVPAVPFSGMTRDTYGVRGYLNFLKLFGVAVPAAIVAALVPGLRIGQAAGAVV